jgi:hypothetical protein
MATQTRDQLDTSNSLNISGAGKVTKAKHATHNNNIGDYIDYRTSPINTTLGDGVDGLVLVSSFIGSVFTFNGELERTFKLEQVSGYVGQRIILINSSSLPSGADCTIQSNEGANDLQNDVNYVSSILLPPGDVKTFYNNGLKWVVI